MLGKQSFRQQEKSQARSLGHWCCKCKAAWKAASRKFCENITNRSLQFDYDNPHWVQVFALQWWRTLLSKGSFFLWLSAPQCQPQQRRIQQDRSPAIWWAQATHRRAYRHDWCCVAPAERCNPFKLGCAKPQNFCLHSCQAISDGERSWRKSHGCLCAQLETAAQVRQTKHTGVQKTEEKNSGPLRGCQTSENTRNHWNTHDMYMDIDIMMYQTPIKTTTISTI